jgi:hypothetical protein
MNRGFLRVVEWSDESLRENSQLVLVRYLKMLAVAATAGIGK